jgi:DNA-binding ferritin-like protein (Dps family)
MRNWSDNLIELSREYLNYSGTRVKSLNGDFGLLTIDYDKNIYTITISDTNEILLFNSVNQIINNGWAVD